MYNLTVAFDARMCYSSGIGTYIRCLLEGLFLPAFDETRPRMLLLGMADDIDLQAFHRRIPFDAPIYSLREQFMMPRFDADLLHVPHYNVPRLTHGVPFTVTIHDCIHLACKSVLSDSKRVVARAMMKHAATKARKIITCSNHSKRDIVRYLGVPEDKITVIYEAVADTFDRVTDEEVRHVKRQYRLPDDYFLGIGSDKPHKNLKLLIDAYFAWTGKHPNEEYPPLVLGGIAKNGTIEEYIRSKGFSSRVSSMPFLKNRRDFAAVIQGARAMIFPSLYEGFGLPVIEAQKLQVPCISSNASSLAEVAAEGSVLFFDPNSSDELINCFEKLLSPDIVATLIKNGTENLRRFSWEDMVRQTLSVWKSCC